MILTYIKQSKTILYILFVFVINLKVMLCKTCRSADWGKPNGPKCFNETEPIKDKSFWGTGSNKEMMKVVSSVVKHMATHVTVINITQLSEYRIDAHTSVYTETGGKMLTVEERADPMRHADCIHWCLPGLPDTWNRILLAHL